MGEEDFLQNHKETFHTSKVFCKLNIAPIIYSHTCLKNSSNCTLKKSEFHYVKIKNSENTLFENISKHICLFWRNFKKEYSKSSVKREAYRNNCIPFLNIKI